MGTKEAQSHTRICDAGGRDAGGRGHPQDPRGKSSMSNPPFTEGLNVCRGRRAGATSICAAGRRHARPHRARLENRSSGSEFDLRSITSGAFSVGHDLLSMTRNWTKNWCSVSRPTSAAKPRRRPSSPVRSAFRPWSGRRPPARIRNRRLCVARWLQRRHHRQPDRPDAVEHVSFRASRRPSRKSCRRSKNSRPSRGW